MGSWGITRAYRLPRFRYSEWGNFFPWVFFPMLYRNPFWTIILRLFASLPFLLSLAGWIFVRLFCTRAPLALLLLRCLRCSRLWIDSTSVSFDFAESWQAPLHGGSLRLLDPDLVALIGLSVSRSQFSNMPRTTTIVTAGFVFVAIMTWIVMCLKFPWWRKMVLVEICRWYWSAKRND